MNDAQKALKVFLDTNVETKNYPQFNAWGANRAYFQAHGIDPLWDMVVDPTRYPFDLGYTWGTFKIIRALNISEYFRLLQEACS